MSAFLRAWSAPAALAFCGAALSLSLAACSGDDSTPSVTGDKNAANAGEGSSKSDGGKTATKPSVKSDGGASTDPGDTNTGDTNTGDTSVNSDGGAPTASSGSLWCGALAVIQDKCQACHTTPLAASAPMPLTTYADLTGPAVVTKGKKVYEVVSTRIHAGTMPAAAPLTAAEMAPIDAWIAAGVPQGDDPTCAGSPPVAEQTPWPPPGCDQSYSLTAGNGSDVSVPAKQETHPSYYYDAPWGAKAQAIAFRPITDNAKVLHHWILYSASGNGAFISGWAPGQDASLRKALPDNIGIYLPSGARSLRLDVHYNNTTGTAIEKDQSGVEVCVTNTPRPVVATTFSGFAQLGIVLLPGQPGQAVGTCSVNITQPTFLMTESPHAHKLATHMKLEVKRGSQTFTLHDAPFTFDAQISTPLPQPFELKQGDQVITTCSYMNDTMNVVTFGENTGNEMCFNFASYYPMGALSCSGQAAINIGQAFGGKP